MCVSYVLARPIRRKPKAIRTVLINILVRCLMLIRYLALMKRVMLPKMIRELDGVLVTRNSLLQIKEGHELFLLELRGKLVRS